MKDKYVRISKEGIWWTIKNVLLVFVLYSIYSMLTINSPTIIITKLGFGDFVMAVILSIMVVIILYCVWDDFIMDVILKGLFKRSGFFDGFAVMSFNIKLTQKEVDAIKNKNKKKLTESTDVRGKRILESDYRLCKRITKERLRGGGLR